MQLTLVAETPEHIEESRVIYMNLWFLQLVIRSKGNKRYGCIVDAASSLKGGRQRLL